MKNFILFSITLILILIIKYSKELTRKLSTAKSQEQSVNLTNLERHSLRQIYQQIQKNPKANKNHLAYWKNSTKKQCALDELKFIKIKEKLLDTLASSWKKKQFSIFSGLLDDYGNFLNFTLVEIEDYTKNQIITTNILKSNNTIVNKKKIIHSISKYLLSFDKIQDIN